MGFLRAVLSSQQSLAEGTRFAIHTLPVPPPPTHSCPIINLPHQSGTLFKLMHLHTVAFYLAINELYMHRIYK